MEGEAMRVRSLVAPIWFACLLTVLPASGYALSLSQMLSGGDEQNLDTFKLIHVADLKEMLSKGTEKVPLYKQNLAGLLTKHDTKVYIYDANSAETRQRFGIIPGATLLSSQDDYSLSVLPPNKDATLVFYCADSH
jgi:hypothetical protein